MSDRRNKTPKAHTPTEAILESISDGVFTVGLQWRITSFNRAYQVFSAKVQHVEYLIGYEGDAFAYTDVLSEKI